MYRDIKKYRGWVCWNDSLATRSDEGVYGSLNYIVREVWPPLGFKFYCAEGLGASESPNHTVRKIWALVGLQTMLCVRFGRLWVSKLYFA